MTQQSSSKRPRRGFESWKEMEAALKRWEQPGFREVAVKVVTIGGFARQLQDMPVGDPLTAQHAEIAKGNEEWIQHLIALGRLTQRDAEDIKRLGAEEYEEQQGRKKES